MKETVWYLDHQNGYNIEIKFI